VFPAVAFAPGVATGSLHRRRSLASPANLCIVPGASLHWPELPVQTMTTRSIMILATTCLLLVAACRSNPHYNPAKSHHTANGFRNNYPQPPRGSFWKWQWDRLTKGIPDNPRDGYNFPLVKPDVAFLAANRSEPTLTWIGHASFLLQVGGVNVLTDPHLTGRASPLSFAGPPRQVQPPFDFDTLPHADVVLISHNHYDHLDLGTVKALNRQRGGPPMFFVPLGLKDWFARQGIGKVTELDWWDSAAYMGLQLTLAPVQHWSARTLWDRNTTLWGAWVVEHPRLRFFFGGDFGYSPDLADIGRHFGHIDLAALPIGAYEPRWFMSVMHVNPDEAVQAQRDLNARYAVAMHWGTFRLTDELLDEPPRKLAAALTRAGVAPERFFVMKHGETRKLDTMMSDSADGTAQPRQAAR
jgi:L-ascorbate metabolism protein UlaG (beta-lactamase superfamily)